MSYGITTNLKNNIPVAGTGTIAGTITVNAASSVDLYEIHKFLKADLDTAYAALVPAEAPTPNRSYPTTIWLLAAAAGLQLGQRTLALSGAVPGFPVTHIQGGQAHPEPLKIAFGDLQGQPANSNLVVANPTAGDIDLHVICWGDP